MNVLILNTQVPYCSGGAEILAADLNQQINLAGHTCEILTLPFKWYPQQTLVNSILASKLYDISSYNGKDVDRVIALKFPVWLIPHENKSFWILHQHRTAYDLWDSEFSDVAAMPDGKLVRDLIRREDFAAISPSDRVFTISQTVTDRLHHYSGIKSGVLYPPPRDMGKYHSESYQDYFFFPSRITPVKRQELVIEALAHVTAPVKVLFAGEPDNPEYFSLLQSRTEELGVSDQVEWLGRIADSEKFELYANALAVIFPPLGEDYGYVSPEAMLSSKAVLTLADSGGATEFVQHGETGLIANPDPVSLASSISLLWEDRQMAQTMGENGRDFIQKIDLSWDKILASLL